MDCFKNISWVPKLSDKYIFLALPFILGVSPTWANNLTVNNMTDVSLPGDGLCSLREAIANANSNSDTSLGDCAAGAGADLISFSVSGTIQLSSTLGISDSAGLIVDGIGRNVILSGNNAVRVMLVNPGALLTVKNLTVSNGYDVAQGGGIYNYNGILNVTNSTFSANSTRRAGGGIASIGDPLSTVNPGGGIVTIINSTFSGNSAYFGGAIWNGGSSSLSLVNSTIVANNAITPLCTGFCTQSLASGGGINNSSFGALNLDNSIVAGNMMIQEMAAGNAFTPSDINGIVTNSSFNLISRPDGLSGALQNNINGNLVGIDTTTILNTTLSNNGGPNQTFALLPASPAIDSALAAKCPATDQRGTARPQGIGCDRGAFELAFSADLAVTETAAPNPILARDLLTWIINVTNKGGATATGVKVVDTLPASGFTFVTASASQGSCTSAISRVITCSLGIITNDPNDPNDGTATITIKLVPSSAVTLTNQVKVTGEQLDEQQANNSVTQSITVQPLLCNGLKPTIVGTYGADTITGSKGRDIIHGLGGNDTINGGNENDIICGGDGQDSLNGNSGNDKLDGGAGTDTCNGGTGTDTSANCEANIAIP